MNRGSQAQVAGGRGWSRSRAFEKWTMLTIILNVLGEVLGIGNLYCTPFCLAGSGPCVRLSEFKNRLLNVVLVNFGRLLSSLIVEQTPTALLVDGQ